jgi:hypothetical protein
MKFPWVIVAAFALSGCQSFDKLNPDYDVAQKALVNESHLEFISPCIMVDNAQILGKTSFVRQFMITDDKILVVDDSIKVIHSFQRGDSLDVDFVPPNVLWISTIYKSVEVQLTCQKWEDLRSSSLYSSLKRNPSHALINN